MYFFVNNNETILHINNTVVLINKKRTSGMTNFIASSKSSVNPPDCSQDCPSDCQSDYPSDFQLDCTH